MMKGIRFVVVSIILTMILLSTPMLAPTISADSTFEVDYRTLAAYVYKGEIESTGSMEVYDYDFYDEWKEYSKYSEIDPEKFPPMTYEEYIYYYEKRVTEYGTYDLTFIKGSENEMVFIDYITGKSTVVPSEDDRSQIRSGDIIDVYYFDDWIYTSHNYVKFIDDRGIAMYEPCTFDVAYYPQFSTHFFVKGTVATIDVDYGSGYKMYLCDATHSGDSRFETRLGTGGGEDRISIPYNGNYSLKVLYIDYNGIESVMTDISYRIDGIEHGSNIPHMLLYLLICIPIIATVVISGKKIKWAQ